MWWDCLKPPDTPEKTRDVLLLPAGINGFLNGLPRNAEPRFPHASFALAGRKFITYASI